MAGLRQSAELRLDLRIRVVKIVACVEEPPAVLRQAAVVDLGGNVVHDCFPLQALYEWQEKVPLQPILVQPVWRPAQRIRLRLPAVLCHWAARHPGSKDFSQSTTL